MTPATAPMIVWTMDVIEEVMVEYFHNHSLNYQNWCFLLLCMFVLEKLDSHPWEDTIWTREHMKLFFYDRYFWLLYIGITLFEATVEYYYSGNTNDFLSIAGWIMISIKGLWTLLHLMLVSRCLDCATTVLDLLRTNCSISHVFNRFTTRVIYLIWWNEKALKLWLWMFPKSAKTINSYGHAPLHYICDPPVRLDHGSDNDNDNSKWQCRVFDILLNASPETAWLMDCHGQTALLYLASTLKNGTMDLSMIGRILQTDARQLDHATVIWVQRKIWSVLGGGHNSNGNNNVNLTPRLTTYILLCALEGGASFNHALIHIPVVYTPLYYSCIKNHHHPCYCMTCYETNIWNQSTVIQCVIEQYMTHPHNTRDTSSLPLLNYIITKFPFHVLTVYNQMLSSSSSSSSKLSLFVRYYTTTSIITNDSYDNYDYSSFFQFVLFVLFHLGDCRNDDDNHNNNNNQRGDEMPSIEAVNLLYLSLRMHPNL